MASTEGKDCHSHGCEPRDGRSIAIRFAAEEPRSGRGLVPTGRIAEVKQEILAAGGIAESWIGDVADRHRTRRSSTTWSGSSDPRRPGQQRGHRLHEPGRRGANRGLGQDHRGLPQWPLLHINAVVPHLRKRGKGGSIVNISSICSYWGLPKASGYTASKAGINGLCKGLVSELSPDRIRVNAIPRRNSHTLERDRVP